MPRKRKEVPPSYWDAFPRVLRSLMEKEGKTQQDLAEHLGKTRQSVSYYCDGSSSPDWMTLAKIAQYFSVSADYLLGLSHEMTREPEVKAVCEYTGLASSTVEYLHDHVLSERRMEAILIDGFVHTEMVGKVPELLVKSAKAQALSIMHSASGESEGSESHEPIAYSDEKQNIRYAIPAKDAAQFYLRAAVDVVEESVLDVLEEMREAVKLDILGIKRMAEEPFEFHSNKEAKENAVNTEEDN